MWGGMAILKNKMGGKCANTRRPVGHVPRDWEITSFLPRRNITSYGATALQAQKMSRYSRKKAGQKSGQHVPEEVLHGVNLLPEECPTRGKLHGYLISDNSLADEISGKYHK